MEFREVAVVGLGTMGAGIAEVFARAGLRVVAIEADPAALSRGIKILDASLARAVSRGRLTGQEQAAILGDRIAERQREERQAQGRPQESLVRR